jgi:hypothetical protein
MVVDEVNAGRRIVRLRQLLLAAFLIGAATRYAR